MPTEAEKQEMERAYLRNTARLKQIIKPVETPIYETHIPWKSIHKSLISLGEDYGGMDLCPDFQRGHVWTTQQQTHYIENCIRNVVPSSGHVVQFNCPNWEHSRSGYDLPMGFQCIDGLQRLTAISLFLKGDILPFGLLVDDFNTSAFAINTTLRIRFSVFTFTKKADLLQHYLDFNTGGTPHSESEIVRVREMMNSK